MEKYQIKLIKKGESEPFYILLDAIPLTGFSRYKSEVICKWKLKALKKGQFPSSAWSTKLGYVWVAE